MESTAALVSQSTIQRIRHLWITREMTFRQQDHLLSRSNLGSLMALDRMLLFEMRVTGVSNAPKSY